MLRDEDVPTTEWGAIDTESDLSVTEHPGLWAVGDCASMPRPNEDGYYPNTAEHGMRAGKVLADNIYAEERGGTRKPFQYTSPGSLVVVGYQTACAELFGYKFSGLFAWLIWRAVYLMKLPGMDRKHRVLIDWITELVFPREMAQTIGEDVLDADGPQPRSREDDPESKSQPAALTSQSGDGPQSALPSEQPTKLTERHADKTSSSSAGETEPTNNQARLQHNE
jgi:hypothetical protein